MCMNRFALTRAFNATVRARTSPYYSVSTNRVEVYNSVFTVEVSNRNGHVAIFESADPNTRGICINCASRRRKPQGGA